MQMSFHPPREPKPSPAQTLPGQEITERQPCRALGQLHAEDSDSN
jgi:hypothetical protein